MVSREEARKYLNNAPSEHNFWVCDGSVLRNLDDLSNLLSHMNEETFSYHSNKDKNDFSNWITDILGDKKLAEELLKAKTRNLAMKKVKERVSMLKKRAS